MNTFSVTLKGDTDLTLRQVKSKKFWSEVVNYGLAAMANDRKFNVEKFSHAQAKPKK